MSSLESLALLTLFSLNFLAKMSFGTVELSIKYSCSPDKIESKILISS